ncbi:MAG: bifunctional diaminohydroxyphosphoribosylaminopyrimidine deaminase/5-amino-6-(5-phosphoribosylamino)uracil reductase RibD [Sphingobacteriales bacterium]|nr:bifunctional diaminohydroxyphosphoribosylaminopyrimidine deaminase/5-amino-6-(5-phosphoribosylamino)uracil reductase RibD [Sphingobacteriales bacterium]MBP9141660.1 bifunctional diaminohydroxyphosphoribosylaminopyrimidine deaminase/5-amino-6-(5-phosphoribosylamino)uracil reductase RibD [Chitinophagales bacterium]MDA0197487.1 bifunctional diaminohydroxyphosphoribosylaminopyrimidine deaminase/5-amino-6-(5-phosphoribosylamino)uracil reductase RibD [Bacteroidota bacterium]MBK6890326.1 bifunctiona
METYLNRCLLLAQRGQGYVAPNPMVGAVLTHNNQIIAEGWHKNYNHAHAEVNAFNNVLPKYKHLIKESTLYVNLEPCAHYGKTPPCAELIVNMGVKRVVVGCQDSFKDVNGKGIALLQQHDIEVITGVCEAESRWLNRRFFTFNEQNRPYIILKWAQTANGYYAPTNKNRQQISNFLTQLITHQWRTQEQAILVGATTVLADNPKLTARLWTGKNPLRMVLNPSGSLAAYPQLHLLSDGQPTVIFTLYPEKFAAFKQVQVVQGGFEAIVPYCRQQKIISVFVEGGASLQQAFLAHSLVDEIRVFTANSLSWASGIQAPHIPSNFELKLQVTLGDNTQSQYNIVYQ